jgi:hypothetical protein
MGRESVFNKDQARTSVFQRFFQVSDPLILLDQALRAVLGNTLVLLNQTLMTVLRQGFVHRLGLHFRFAGRGLFGHGHREGIGGQQRKRQGEQQWVFHEVCLGVGYGANMPLKLYRENFIRLMVVIIKND